MANAGTVNVVLTAVTTPFEKGMAVATGTLSRFGSALTSVQALATGFLAFKGISYIKGTMEAVDVTAKLADRLGIGTEALGGLQHASDLAGVSSDSLATSLEKMSRNLTMAGTESAPVSKALQDLRLSFSDLAGKSPDEQLGLIADGLKNVGTSGERSAALVAIFGKSGAEMSSVLQDGSKGLREAREEADALGITFSRLDAFKVEQANDALSRVSAVFRGAFTQAAIELSPIIEGIATRFVDAAKASGGFGVVATRVMDAIKYGVGIVGDAWNVLMTGWNLGKALIYGVGIAFAATADGVVRGVQYIAGIWNNWVMLVQDSSRLLGASVEFLWAKLKQGIASFVQFSAQQLAGMLHTAAEAAGMFDAELGASLTSAAHSVGVATGGMAADARKSAESAAASMKFAAQDVKTSWDGLFNVETTGSPLMQGLRDSFAASATEAGSAYVTAFESVLNQDASKTVADFFAGMEATSTASATAAAERAAVRLEVDREAGAVQVEEAEIRETYLTELFGAQAEKRLKFEKQTLSQRLDYTANILGNLATLQNTNSKRMFQIGKLAAYGQAIVTTAAGIARQFADLPIYAAIPAAAAVAVAGAAQISAIASTSFGGGGSVSSAGGSVPLVNGEPVGMGQSASSSNFSSQNQRQTQEVRITGLPDDMMLTGQQARKLWERLQDAMRDGSGSVTYNMSMA